LCDAVCPATSPPGPQVPGLPAGQDPSPHPPGTPTHPHPSTTIFSPSYWLSGTFAGSTVMVSIIVLLSFIAHPNGWKQFHFPIHPAACAKALSFSWISCFGVPETNTSDHGPQFTSNLWLNFVRCSTSRIDKQLHTIPSQTGQSKDCTAASQMRFVHAPP
jgi:hypothetical protein